MTDAGYYLYPNAWMNIATEVQFWVLRPSQLASIGAVLGIPPPADRVGHRGHEPEFMAKLLWLNY
jgi:hypothetical protein